MFNDFYLHIHVHIHSHLYLHMHIHLHVHMHMHTFTLTSIHSYIHTFRYSYNCTCYKYSRSITIMMEHKQADYGGSLFLQKVMEVDILLQNVMEVNSNTGVQSPKCLFSTEPDRRKGRTRTVRLTCEFYPWF